MKRKRTETDKATGPHREASTAGSVFNWRDTDDIQRSTRRPACPWRLPTRGLALPPPETQPVSQTGLHPKRRPRAGRRTKKMPQRGALPFCVLGKSSPNSFPKLQAPMGVPSPSEPGTGRSVPLPPRPRGGLSRHSHPHLRDGETESH